MEGLSIFPLGNSSPSMSNPLMVGLEGLKSIGKEGEQGSFLSIYSENTNPESLSKLNVSIEDTGDLEELSPEGLVEGLNDVLKLLEGELAVPLEDLDLEDIERIADGFSSLEEFVYLANENMDSLSQDQMIEVGEVLAEVNELLNQKLGPVISDVSTLNSPMLTTSTQVNQMVDDASEIVIQSPQSSLDLKTTKKAADQWSQLLVSNEFEEFKAIEGVRRNGKVESEPIELLLGAPVEKQKELLAKFPELKSILMPLMKEVEMGQGVNNGLEINSENQNLSKSDKPLVKADVLHKELGVLNVEDSKVPNKSEFLAFLEKVKLNDSQSLIGNPKVAVENNIKVEGDVDPSKNLRQASTEMLKDIPVIKEIIQNLVYENKLKNAEVEPLSNEKSPTKGEVNKEGLNNALFVSPKGYVSEGQKQEWYKAEERLLGKGLPETSEKVEKNTPNIKEQSEGFSLFADQNDSKINAESTVKANGAGYVEVIRKDFNGQTLSVETVPSYRTTPLESFTAVSQVTKQVDWMLGEGQSEMSFRLRPEHLGEVAVSIGLKDNVMKLSVEVESMKAMEALHEGMEEMRKSVESLLHKVEKVDVTLVVDPKLANRPDPRDERKRMRDNRQEQNSKSNDDIKGNLENDENRHKIRLMNYNTQEYIV